MAITFPSSGMMKESPWPSPSANRAARAETRARQEHKRAIHLPPGEILVKTGLQPGKVKSREEGAWASAAAVWVQRCSKEPGVARRQEAAWAASAAVRPERWERDPAAES